MDYLQEKHMRCIEMLIDKNMNVSAVARELGVSRGTIYNWLNDERFKAELHKSEQEIKDRMQHIFIRRLPEAIEKLWKLTETADNRTKLGATKEWVDRAIGKVNTSVTVEDKRENADESSLEEIINKANEMLKQSAETNE